MDSLNYENIDKIKWIETKLDAHKILKEMLYECAIDMINAGLPIQTEKTTGIYIQKVEDAQAICAFGQSENGDLNFSIIIDEEFANHMNDRVVLENVKNSIYHELLHTCPDCEDHNPNWLAVAIECDEKLGTKTRTRQDDEIYYNQAQGMATATYECEHCGFRFDTIRDYGEYIICPIDEEKAYKKLD
jgi:hypothetical protein